MTRLLMIRLIGAAGSGLIIAIGSIWRAKYLVSITAAAGVAWSLGIVGIPNSEQHHRSEKDLPATMAVLSWGERDMTHIDDHTGFMSPAHLVYATVALTAGSTPISIPSIAEANPELVVWLSVDDSGRTSHAIRNSVAEDGSSISLVPSHDDGLVREVGGPILPIPGTQCAALLPGNRCEVTLTWWFYGHGKIDRIRGLTLAALNAATAELQNNAPYEPWPTTKAETECRGVMAEWCSS